MPDLRFHSLRMQDGGTGKPTPPRPVLSVVTPSGAIRKIELDRDELLAIMEGAALSLRALLDT